MVTIYRFRATPAGRAASLRELATDRFREAMAAYRNGDRDRWWELMQDVRAFEARAKIECKRGRRIVAQQCDRAGQVRALDRLIALVRADVEDRDAC